MGYFISNTKNRSFIEMSNKLKEKGEEKYDFILKVYDEDLINFDLESYIEAINSEDDAISSRAYDKFNKKIHEECRKNVWFFFREIFRVPFFNGTMIPFTLTDLSLQVIQLYSHDLGCISNNSKRQNGKSILFVGLYIYNKFIHLTDKDDVDTHYAVKNKKYASEIEKTYKKIRAFLTKNHLPSGINEPTHLSVNDNAIVDCFIDSEKPFLLPFVRKHCIFIDDAFMFNNINDLYTIFNMLSENSNRVMVYSINSEHTDTSSKRFYNTLIIVLSMISEKFNTVSSYESLEYMTSLYKKRIRTIILKEKLD